MYLAGFLGSLVTAAIRAAEALRYYQVRHPGGFASPASIYTLKRTIPSVRARFTPASTLRSRVGCRNINRLSIVCAHYTDFHLGPD